MSRLGAKDKFLRRKHRFGWQKPLVLIGSVPRDGQTGVSPDIRVIKLIFGRDFENDQGWINVCNKIDMWQDGNQIPIRIRKGKDKCFGHHVILVIPCHSLDGGLTYKVRVKSTFVEVLDNIDGVVDNLDSVNNNVQTFTKAKLIAFTTAPRS